MDDKEFTVRLENSIETLRLAEKELKEKNFEILQEIASLTHPLPDLAEFWKELNLTVKKLSLECTKLCIAYTNFPYPTSEETIAHVQSIEIAVMCLFSVVHKFNIGLGKTLHDKIIENTINTVDATTQLISLVKKGGGSEISEKFSRATGVVWEGCKYLEKCPKNNKLAVLLQMKIQESMVNDALGEINAALEGNGIIFDGLDYSSSEEEQPSWTERDKKRIVPTVNIIKAAKIMCKRISQAVSKNGSCDTIKQVRELDQLVTECLPISSLVDSLVIELYPPLNVGTMEAQTHTLASHVFSGVKTAIKSHFVTEEEQADIEFIENAVTHNLNKMKEVLRDS